MKTDRKTVAKSANNKMASDKCCRSTGGCQLSVLAVFDGLRSGGISAEMTPMGGRYGLLGSTLTINRVE
jgi:hypothetical protein